MKGKSAIVTGSTSGIGLGIARALAAQGVNVMLNGFGDADEIRAIRTKLEADHGIRVVYSGADMTRPAEIHAMVQQAIALFGIIHSVFLQLCYQPNKVIFDVTFGHL